MPTSDDQLRRERAERAERAWERAEMLVMGELERLNNNMRDLTKETQLLKIELATLTTVVQLKSGVWGAIAGLIPALAMFLFWIMGAKH